MQLIHLVPHLPPEICGLGDYATLVGEKMEDLHSDVRSLFLACGHRPTTVATESTAARDVTGSCEANSLWRAVTELVNEQPADQVNLVLHYSGYGYAPNGVPSWLAEAIEHRPADCAEYRVTTVFHELFATGRPWERAFWSSGRQQSVARRIAAASDGLLTNRYESARWLEQATGSPTGSVPHLAVPSNVGEMEQVARVAIAIADGSAIWRRTIQARVPESAGERDNRIVPSIGPEDRPGNRRRNRIRFRAVSRCGNHDRVEGMVARGQSIDRIPTRSDGANRLLSWICGEVRSPGCGSCPWHAADIPPRHSSDIPMDSIAANNISRCTPHYLNPRKQRSGGCLRSANRFTIGIRPIH